jgi:hypothetical protein
LIDLSKPINRRAAFAAIVAAALGGGARADEVAAIHYAGVAVKAGDFVRVGVLASRTRTCAPAPAPGIVVKMTPKLGSLTVRPGAMTMAPTAACPNLRTPALIVFYRARPGAAGADRFAYEVVPPAGKREDFIVTVDVKPGSPRPAPANAPAPGSDHSI